MDPHFVASLFSSQFPSLEDKEEDLSPLWYAELAIALYERGRGEGPAPDPKAFHEALEDTRTLRKLYLGLVAVEIPSVSGYSDFVRCVRAKLPRDHRPTRKEMETAVKACVKK